MVTDQTLETAFGLAPRTTARWGDLIRATTGVLACLLVAAMAVIYDGTLRTTITLRHLQDYGMFDHGARQLRAGESIYSAAPHQPVYDVARALNLNPPHFHLVLLPLTLLSPEQAFAAWMVISAIALIWSLALIRRTFRLGVWGTATLVAGCVLSPAMHTTLLTGQIGLVLLVPATLAFLHSRAGRETTAAIWLGVLASIKPFFLLFALDFAVRKRWRPLTAMVATGAAIVAAGLILLGPDSYVQWMTQLVQVNWAEHFVNASLLGAIERTFAATLWGQHPIVDAPGSVRPLWLIASCVVGLSTMLALRVTRSPDWRFVMTTSAMLLISPLGWVYYLWFLLPALTGILIDTSKLPKHALLLVWLGLLAILTPTPLPWHALRSTLGTATVGSIYTWGLLCLFLASITVALRAPVRAAQS
jgi:glycosyl transferase family 87